MRVLTHKSEMEKYMTSQEALSASNLKVQAKRLKEQMESLGNPITHSQALETVAKINGFKDWNVAVAKAKTVLRTYVLCCSFETKDSPDDIGYFQYIIRYESLEGLIDTFKAQIREILENDVNKTWVTKLYLDDIVEIENIDGIGVPVNMLIPDHKNKGSLHCVLPFSKRSKNVQNFQFRPNGFNPDENDLETLEPILIFEANEK